jgi:MYXO-CTERM domain-containing protein
MAFRHGWASFAVMASLIGAAPLALAGPGGGSSGSSGASGSSGSSGASGVSGAAGVAGAAGSAGSAGGSDLDGGVAGGDGGDGYAVADGGTPGAILATPCADGDVSRCMYADPLVYDKKVQLPVAFDWDTNWIPDGSPLQVRFFVKLPAFSHVQMKGGLLAKWPEAITLTPVGLRKTGIIDFDYGLEVGAKAKLDVSVLGQDFGWEGDIPYLPNVDFHVKGQKGFEPWAWAPGATATGFTSKVTIFMVDITDIIIPIPGIGGGISLDVQGELGVNYHTEKVVIKPANTPVTIDAPSARHDWVQGAWAEYNVHPEGKMDYVGTIHLIPSFYVEILGKKFSIPITDFPYALNLGEQDWAFDDQLVHVPLPDIRPPAKPDLRADKVVVGDETILTIQLPNIGEAMAQIEAKTDSEVFKPLNPFVQFDPGKSATISVRFTPKLVGTQKATLTLETNDPDTPLILISLEGEGLAAPPDPVETEPDAGTKPPKDGGGAGGEAGDPTHVTLPGSNGDPSSSGGCGCRVAGDGPAPAHAPLLLLAGGLVLGARRRRRA